MNILFTKLEEPVAVDPDGLKKTIITVANVNETNTVSNFQDTIYNERIRQQIRDKKD